MIILLLSAFCFSCVAASIKYPKVLKIEIPAIAILIVLNVILGIVKNDWTYFLTSFLWSIMYLFELSYYEYVKDRIKND